MRPQFRLLLLSLVLACALMLSGCVKYSIVVLVNPDGSGQIHETAQFNAALIEGIMQGMVAGMGAEGGEKPTLESTGEPWEDTARKKASEYGPGVKLVEATEERKEGWQIRKAVYAFDDVTKLKSPPPQDGEGPAAMTDPSAMVNIGAQGAGQSFPEFGFRRLDDATSELIIRIPPADEKKDAEEPQAEEGVGGEAPAGDSEMDEAAKQMFQQFFKDFEMYVGVECAGQVLETNATYREGNRITLVHLSFEDLLKLMDDPEKMAELEKLGPKPDSMVEAQLLLQKVTGVEYEAQPEVKIKFQK